MKMLRMKCVLIAVFLQLCFSVHVVKADNQFGDLLIFPESEFMDKALYDHYAIYVGGEAVNGKGEDQNIFEMIKKPTSGCRFAKKTGPFKVVNDYYDFEHKPQSKTDMIKTIEELMSDEKCKKYDLIKGNCEHIATMVRYGKAFCNQKGAIIGLGLPKWNTKGNLKRREASAAA